MCEIAGRNASTEQSCGTAAELYKRLELSLRNISMYGTVILPDYCAAEVHLASGSLESKKKDRVLFGMQLSLRNINMCGTIIL